MGFGSGRGEGMDVVDTMMNEIDDLDGWMDGWMDGWVILQKQIAARVFFFSQSKPFRGPFQRYSAWVFCGCWVFGFG
jgi:hypothetical protein